MKIWDYKIMELIKDPNGTLSHTKIWSNVGYSAITYAFLDTCHAKGATPELILAYAAAVGVYRLGNKYIDTLMPIQGSADGSTNTTPDN
ncbi:MAG: hypothetical protein JHC33_09615 [Ignisphaera sp.]|nr:hypothetical protein [Ignisphaera sp.]